MRGDSQARFRENLRVKLPWVTRLAARRPERTNKRRLDDTSVNRTIREHLVSNKINDNEKV